MAWSDLCLEDFDAEYWNRLWRWYYAGGLDAVAAHLSDLAGYDAIKAIGANRCQDGRLGSTVAVVFAAGGPRP